MAKQYAIQDQNRFPALIGHTGTANTAETVRLVSTTAGALTVDLVSGDAVTVSVGTITTGSLTDVGKLHTGTIQQANVTVGTFTPQISVGTIPQVSVGTLPDPLGSVVATAGTVTSNTPYSYAYTATGTTNWVIKNSAGFLYAVLVGDAAGTGVIEISDHASDGDGAVVLYLAGDNIGPALYPVNMTMGTGISADITNQTHVTVIYK